MSADRDVNRIVRSWLEEGATALPDRVLDNVLDQLPATPQRRSWWPARRFRDMNTLFKLAIAAAAVVVVALVGINLLPRSDGVGGSGTSASPAPSPTASPSASLGRSPSPSPVLFPNGPLPAGSHTIQPFVGPGGLCMGQAGCTEAGAEDDSIRITVTVPDGWSGFESQRRSLRREILATRRSQFALHARRLVVHRLAALWDRTDSDRTEHPDRHDRRRVRDGARGSS